MYDIDEIQKIIEDNESLFIKLKQDQQKKIQNYNEGILSNKEFDFYTDELRRLQANNPINIEMEKLINWVQENKDNELIFIKALAKISHNIAI